MQPPFVLETRSLIHSFADRAQVLGGISLQVPEGAVYGFLGANGAGKTTTLKLVLGLLEIQRGEILLFGKKLGKDRLDALSRIGAMIESPSLYGHLTAYENLLVLQKVYRCPPGRIAEVLDMVGLATTGTKKAGRFSLGMKQRLAIAMALLHEPQLLVLDEPTNGLDPNGMIEIRELLLELNRTRGTTIVISSHLLGEIEKMVSHLGIIHKGSLLFQGTLAQLQSEQNDKSGLVLKTNKRAETAALLTTFDLSPVFRDGAFHFSAPQPGTVASLVRELTVRDISLYELSPVKNDLEGIFMNMITD